MEIYWKDQLAYDEKDNFLAIIHKMPNNSYIVILHYPSEDIDYRQLDISEPTLKLAMEQTEAIFKQISDISEIENLLSNPCDYKELSSKILDFLSEFTTHRP